MAAHGGGIEYVSIAGLRVDGRRPNEARRLAFDFGVVSGAQGSAFFAQGNTKVIASVYGPREVAFASQAEHDRAVLKCEVYAAPFSTVERRKRSAGDRRAVAAGRVLQKALEATVLTHLFPRSQIEVFVQVLQGDGGNACAAINAATLALCDAGIPMRELVVACAAGRVDGHVLVDLNHLEESSGQPCVPVSLLPRANKIVTMELAAKLPLDQFDAVLTAAMDGCRTVYQKIENALRERTHAMAAARGGADE